jgi:hypothetical protein
LIKFICHKCRAWDFSAPRQPHPTSEKSLDKPADCDWLPR